jgi:hypothetical protein
VGRSWNSRKVPGTCCPTKTIEFLAVDVKEEADIIPTENGAEGFIKFVEMERVPAQR